MNKTCHETHLRTPSKELVAERLNQASMVKCVLLAETLWQLKHFEQEVCYTRDGGCTYHISCPSSQKPILCFITAEVKALLPIHSDRGLVLLTWNNCWEEFQKSPHTRPTVDTGQSFSQDFWLVGERITLIGCSGNWISAEKRTGEKTGKLPWVCSKL